MPGEWVAPVKPLEEKITDFCRCLRRFGISVAGSEIADALRALSLVGLERDDVYGALACTLIKEKADMSIFTSLFRMYFKGKSTKAPEEDTGDPFEDVNGPGNDGREPARVEAANSSGVVSEQRMRSGIDGEPCALLIKAVKEGDYDLLQALAHHAVQNISGRRPHGLDDARELVKRAQIFLGWEKAMDEVFEGVLSSRASFF